MERALLSRLLAAVMKSRMSCGVISFGCSSLSAIRALDIIPLAILSCRDWISASIEEVFSRILLRICSLYLSLWPVHPFLLAILPIMPRVHPYLCERERRVTESSPVTYSVQISSHGYFRFRAINHYFDVYPTPGRSVSLGGSQPRVIASTVRPPPPRYRPALSPQDVSVVHFLTRSP